MSPPVVYQPRSSNGMVAEPRPSGLHHRPYRSSHVIFHAGRRWDNVAVFQRRVMVTRQNHPTEIPPTGLSHQAHRLQSASFRLMRIRPEDITDHRILHIFVYHDMPPLTEQDTPSIPRRWRWHGIW